MRRSAALTLLITLSWQFLMPALALTAPPPLRLVGEIRAAERAPTDSWIPRHLDARDLVETPVRQPQRLAPCVAIPSTQRGRPLTAVLRVANRHRPTYPPRYWLRLRQSGVDDDSPPA